MAQIAPAWLPPSLCQGETKIDESAEYPGVLRLCGISKDKDREGLVVTKVDMVSAIVEESTSSISVHLIDQVLGVQGGITGSFSHELLEVLSQDGVDVVHVVLFVSLVCEVGALSRLSVLLSFQPALFKVLLVEFFDS